jgi:preprotein translocase subunit SecD
MKTIYYLVFVALLCLAPGFSGPNTSKDIILESADINVSPESLKQAAVIISGRLKTFDLESSVRVISDKNQIKVQIPDNISISEIVGLLTARGSLGFYETLTAEEIADLAKTETRSGPSHGRLGCSTFEDKHIADSVESLLKSIKISSDYKLLWDSGKSNSGFCLYAVKVRPAMTKGDIDHISSSWDTNSQSFTIEIRFKKPAAEPWARITGRSLNKPIAIVIDDKVFYTPVVKTSIENGLCEITGSFTKKEVNYFLALVNSETLPLSLILK